VALVEFAVVSRAARWDSAPYLGLGYAHPLALSEWRCAQSFGVKNVFFEKIVE